MAPSTGTLPDLRPMGAGLRLHDAELLSGEPAFTLSAGLPTHPLVSPSYAAAWLRPYLLVTSSAARPVSSAR